MNIFRQKQRRLIKMKNPRYRVILILALALCIAFALPGLSASAENVGSFTVGQEMGWVEFYSGSLPITNVELNSGGLPAGVRMAWDGSEIYITGVPENTGSFIAEYIVYTEEGALYATVSFTVNNAAATPAPSSDLVITKHPTGESVQVGGAAKFIARADNAERIVWRLVSPDTTETVQCNAVDGSFPGLEVSGLGTDTLILSNIPRSLDGWCVEAQFWQGNQHLESWGAKITIVDEDGNHIAGSVPAASVTPEPAAPASTPAPAAPVDLPIDVNAKTANISVQPESIELKPGESYTLSVLATSPNNGTLSYQWYSAATDNFAAKIPISGASDASYTVNQADGTAYYWVAIWNTKDGSRSEPVYSDAASVSIAAPATATPAPTPVPEPTPAPRGGRSSVNFQLVLFGIIGVLALAALIGVVIFLRADEKNGKSAQQPKDTKKNDDRE